MNQKKTKIICTLGPASNNEETLTEMLKNGMDVARLNFSHGTHEYHRENIALFRRVRDQLKMPAAILLDTKGPEVRIGDFAEGRVTVHAGDPFTFTTEPLLGDASHVSITYEDLPAQLHRGCVILVDDGSVSMTVQELTKTEVRCTVEVGGELSNHKGVNIPNVHLDLQYLSPADEADLKFGVEMDVDYIAASFVRCKEDVLALRNFLDYHGGQSIRIIAKIENTEGVQNFDEILACADGIMIARGDMGVEIDYVQLPGLQKKFIRKCYQAGKIVITATQMLESMIHNARPTRAEITDVANAVFDGTSAIMLSGETAVGAHPALVVKTMSLIARQAEADAFSLKTYHNFAYETDHNDATNAICDAACTTARDLHAAAILAITTSGYTARGVSKFRPIQPIIAPTPVAKTFHQLSLSWGVYPVIAVYQPDANVLFTHAIACAKLHGLVQEGDRVVITAGTSASTDLLKVDTVPSHSK